jgi:hypothetical protein
MGSADSFRGASMKGTGKYIGVNQRVPFDVLDAGLYRFLRDQSIDKESIVTHIREFTKGENRVLKAAQYAVQILSRQGKYILEIRKSIDAEGYLKLPVADRKTIILCLVALTYPITYDLLVALASGFKVQPQINRQFINQKMAALYGSNRSIYNAIDAVIPMIIELGAVERVKISIYSLCEKSVVTHPVIKELVIFTDIKLSGSKSILIDDIQYRPWYMFFEISLGKKLKFSLIKHAESRIGQGYLTI